MKPKKQLVVVTGMSGAGKNTAVRAFEDLNFYCIDNLPPDLLTEVVKLRKDSKTTSTGLAVVVDVRAGELFDGFLNAYAEISNNPNNGYSKPKILFLDTADAILVRRFKETRRRHPLFEQTQNIWESIKEERRLLADVKEQADRVIDTSNLEPEGLRKTIAQYFGTGAPREGLVITVVSFGFKYGVPLDADLVFDVRFLANPYWVESLRQFNGKHQSVARYVLSDPLTEPLLERLFSLVEYSIPQYSKEGKAYLTIAIGCTGGKHRSVVIADELAKFLKARDCNVIVEHRDCPAD